MAVRESSLSLKRSPENDGFPSKLKRRRKPCAVRDFPPDCGPWKPNSGIHSQVECSTMLESSPSGFSEKSGAATSGTDGGRTEDLSDMEKPKIVAETAEEMACENERKFGRLDPVLERAIAAVAEFIALTREFAAAFNGKSSDPRNSTDVVFAKEMTLIEAAKTVEVGVLSAGQYLGKDIGEGGAEKSGGVPGKNNAGPEMKWDDLGDESTVTEGDGVGDKTLEETISEKGGSDVKLERVQEKNSTGLEREWENLGDDLYVLSPQAVKLWELRAKVSKSEKCVGSDGEGGDVIDSQGTEIIDLEEDSSGEFSVSGRDMNGQYEIEKEHAESVDNFFRDDSRACVEFKDTCNDEPKNHRTVEEALVNWCIVEHDRPEGYKVKEVLLKFDEYYEAMMKKSKEQKPETGEGPGGKRYPYREVAVRLKAEGMCISVQKPFGHIPGIEIGDTFRFRAQLVVVGLHRQMICGIDYVTIGDEKFATCVVDSGRYNNEARTNDSLIYLGQGGNPKLVDKAADQKLVKGNLAMVNSMEKGYPVRVIRKKRSGMASYGFGRSKDSYVYAYDGLYKIAKYWRERDENGRLVFKFELVRMLDCSRPCRSHQIIGKSRKRLHKEICVVDDISQGLESDAIRAMNGIDDLGPPPFTYINKIIYPDWCSREEPIGCNCINGCSDSHQCPCVVRNGGEIPFNEEGSIVRSRPIVHECGPNCECPLSCMNRVSQHCPRIRLEIFKTKEREWGVRTRDYVASGSFICEYIGELLREKEAEQRIDHDEYLFNIGDGHDEDGEFEDLVGSRNHVPFVIDACKFGNVGRFVNHSCSPNMYAQEVLYDHDDPKKPHIMFFATRNIPALHELTYNYNYTIDRVFDANGNIKKKHCFCGAPKCKGRMY